MPTCAAHWKYCVSFFLGLWGAVTSGHVWFGVFKLCTDICWIFLGGVSKIRRSVGVRAHPYTRV